MSHPKMLAAIEVGSTFTKLALFREHRDELSFLLRFATRTTVTEGDVGLGVDRLLATALKVTDARLTETYVSSSAAGGLRIAVSGLTPTLSTKVATEAALSAGGVVVHAVAGRLRPPDVDAMRKARPGLILICGGTDYGEIDMVIQNAKLIARARLQAMTVYAGTVRAREDVHEAFSAMGADLALADNVYPDSDNFSFDHVRDVIRRTYERDVVKAPGLDAACERLGAYCVPTPLAVSRAVHVLGRLLGGVLVLDVGGATTDVHSYRTERVPDDMLPMSFEPQLKRTVEGDLGVFHNLDNLMMRDEKPPPAGALLIDRESLCRYALRAVRRALERHCGTTVDACDAGTNRVAVRGPDLTGVGAVMVTGGALVYGLANARQLAGCIASLGSSRLAPRKVEHWLTDHQYLMSSLGLLCDCSGRAVCQFLERGLEEGSL